jgi:hypothetical protein
MMNDENDILKTSFTPECTLMHVVHIVIPTIIVLGLVFFIQALESGIGNPLSYLLNCLLNPLNVKSFTIDLSVILLVLFLVETSGFRKFNLFALKK